jgi:tRNA(Arg) A34 adenosine deaminase TadA
MVEHESYMATAVELAVGRPAHPFAALLVDGSTGEVIADGVNSTKTNPLFHGEIVCINNAAKSFTRFDWKNTILYTTAEPCCMCQAAILWSRIPHVVFGTSIETLRSLGWDQFSMEASDVIDAAPFTNCKVTGGVLVERCDALFQVAAEIRRSRR